LCKNNSKGFSNWKGYWKNEVDVDSGVTIEKLFNELRENQIKFNAWNFWWTVPLENLKKAIFKTDLQNNASGMNKLASMLFLYRTLLIFLGLFGTVYIFKSESKIWVLLFFFFALVYFTICFGTGAQMRNIEIRYFLQADVLLLFPASFTIYTVCNKLKIVRKIKQ
jgi:hypothetical protein